MTDVSCASNPTGPSLLDKSTAHPGSIDKSIFEKKTGPAAGSSMGQGTVNPNYLKECREDNPEPASSAASQNQVALSNCRFLTPTEELRCDEKFEMAVDAKVTGSANLEQVIFRLYSFLTKDGKEERSKVHTWLGSGKSVDPKADPVVVKATGKLVYEMGTDLAKPIPFEIEAKYCQQEPAKSPRVEVANKSVAHWIGGDDLHFATDGEFPLLGADGGLIQVLSAAVKRFEKPVEKGETTICFGFASSAGDADANRKLSLRRAKVVKAILDRDENAWNELAKANFGTSDIQQFLADLHAACGWECDPGAVDGQAGPKTKEAVASFQRECNSRYDLGLKEDGICGPRTWSAVLRAIVGQVQAALGQDANKAPSWPKAKWGNAGTGVYGNGEDFATGGDKPEERSVQITFFLIGAEPRLEDPKPGQKATTKDNPVQDEKLVEKKKMEKEVWATKKGELTKAAISNLRWENPEAWEGTEAKLIAETTLKNGVAVKVKLLVNGKEIFTGGGNVASGKLSFSWTVCECGIGEGAGVPEQVTVSAQAEADGKIFAAIGDLTARFLVSTDWENFSQDYKWGAFAVHSEFRQRFHAHAVEVEVESKVVKAWGGYLVKMTRAGISDKIDGCGFAGYRFGRVSGVGSLPNEYFDGEKWKKMPRGFVPQDGEYNAKAFVPLESNPVMEFFVGRKYGMEGHEEFVWPDTFADYSYDAPKYTKKRASWIKDTKTRWSGKFKLRSKGCVGQHKGAGGGHPVRLDFSMSLKERFEPHVIGLCPGNLRSNARCFFYGESRIAMAAHEVGHLVGLPDEYVGGAVDPTINGDGAVAGIDATTLMGQSLGNVKKRHFVNFAEMANRIAKKKTKTATDFVAS